MQSSRRRSRSWTVSAAGRVTVGREGEKERKRKSAAGVPRRGDPRQSEAGGRASGRAGGRAWEPQRLLSAARGRCEKPFANRRNNRRAAEQRLSLCRHNGRLDGRGPRGRRGQESADQLRQGRSSNTKARAEETETVTAGHENEASPRGLKLNQRARRARRVWQPGGETAPDKIVTREPCKGCVEVPSMGTGKVPLSSRTLGSELASRAKRSCQSKASKLASRGQKTAQHAGTGQSATHTASDTSGRIIRSPNRLASRRCHSNRGSPTPCHHPSPASRHSSAVVGRGKQESTKRWCKIWSRFLHPRTHAGAGSSSSAHTEPRERETRLEHRP